MYRSSRLYSKGVHSNQPNNHSLCYECCTRFDMIPGHKKRRPDLLLAFFFWVADNRVTYRRLAAAGNSLLEISRLGAPHEGHGSFLTGWGGDARGRRARGRTERREGGGLWTDGWKEGRGNYRSETRLALPVGGRVAQWMSARGGYMYRSSTLYIQGRPQQPNRKPFTLYEYRREFDSRLGRMLAPPSLGKGTQGHATKAP